MPKLGPRYSFFLYGIKYEGYFVNLYKDFG